jgi:hypothetical protein
MRRGRLSEHPALIQSRLQADRSSHEVSGFLNCPIERVDGDLPRVRFALVGRQFTNDLHYVP